MSDPAIAEENTKATLTSGSIFSRGGRYVGIPGTAVNRRYDDLPPRSAKFNSEWDNSAHVWAPLLLVGPR